MVKKRCFCNSLPNECYALSCPERVRFQGIISPSNVPVQVKRRQISVGSSLRARSLDSAQLSLLREPGAQPNWSSRSSGHHRGETQTGPRQTATANQVAAAMTGERFTASSRPGSRLASGLGEASDTLQNTACPLAQRAQDCFSWRAFGRTPGSAPHLTPASFGENARLRLSPHCPPPWGECQAPPLPTLPASLGRTPGSASPHPARLPGENARLRLSPPCPPPWGERQAPPLPSLPASLGRTPGSAPPLTARLPGENARLCPSPHCPLGDTHSTDVSSLHCPFQTVGCLWEGPSTALSVAEQDPLLGNRLRIMTTAMAALLRAALPAVCYSVAPEPSPRPLTSQSQA